MRKLCKVNNFSFNSVFKFILLDHGLVKVQWTLLFHYIHGVLVAMATEISLARLRQLHQSSEEAWDDAEKLEQAIGWWLQYAFNGVWFKRRKGKKGIGVFYVSIFSFSQWDQTKELFLYLKLKNKSTGKEN